MAEEDAKPATGSEPLKDDSNEKEDSNEKFVRWQKFRIDQFGYTLNLTLTFTIAALGYWFALLRDKEFLPGPSARCCMLLSLLTLGISAICGFACALTRLWDFRGSAERARKKPSAPSQDHLDHLGRTSWFFLYAQLIGFAIGLLAIATAMLLTDGGKLA